MKPKVRRASAVPFAPRDHDDGSACDWDVAVRIAFVDGCLREGVRAELTQDALRDVVPPAREAVLRDHARAAAVNAALGWLRLETCFARYGELAALALARCLDETELDLRMSARPIEGRAPRSSGILPASSAVPGLAITQRGRERLARFWSGTTFRAA